MVSCGVKRVELKLQGHSKIHIMVYVTLLREWRRQKNAPNGSLGLLLLVVLIGAAIYIFMFPRGFEKPIPEPEDYYDEISKREWQQFQPKSFKAVEKPSVLLDQTDFEFLINVPNPTTWCVSPSNKTRVLLIVVVSLKKNVVNRELIRKTWGSLQRITRWSIKVIFVMGGRSKRDKDQLSESAVLIDEITLRKDMVIGNFEEEFGMRKLRTQIMAFKWALTYCSNAAFVLKTTDSVFIDTFAVAEMATYTNSEFSAICGLTMPTPSEPEHCRPEAVMLSMDVVESVYMLANDEFRPTSKIMNNHKRAAAPVNISQQSKRVLQVNDQLYLSSLITNKLQVSLRNIDHKMLYDAREAFKWANNGELGRDQKMPWTFVLIPDMTDFSAKKGTIDMWKKTVKVTSLVFQFELSSRGRAIVKNMQISGTNAERRLIA